MSGLSLPVDRPTGRALLVGASASRSRPLEVLRGLGFEVTESDNPYAAMAELCQRPMAYRAIILGLASVYREELSIVSAVRTRFPHVEIWLAQTDGRQAALAEAMRQGADGLLADDGLHRVAGAAAPAHAAGVMQPPAGIEPAPSADVEQPSQEPAATGAGAGPILTPDELRALLQEQAPVPPDED